MTLFQKWIYGRGCIWFVYSYFHKISKEILSFDERIDEFHVLPRLSFYWGYWKRTFTFHFLNFVFYVSWENHDKYERMFERRVRKTR